MKLLLTSLLVVATLLPALASQVIYVDADANGQATGSGWADAYTDLQTALSAAQPGDQVWVAEGRYRPGVPTDPVTVSFAIPDGVTVYGGFAGTETLATQRDWVSHVTVLDADLKGDDALGRESDNVMRVVMLGNGGTPVVLDGFVVRGARGGLDGGGVFVPGGAPTLVHCIFEDNRVTHAGGGVFVAGGAPTFLDCTFSFNDGSIGGGLYVAAGSSPLTVTLDDCDFVGNRATQTTVNDGDGGGLFSEAGIDLALDRVVFLSNQAIRTLPNTISEGGGLCSVGGTVTIFRAYAQANTANLGGGFYVAGTLLASHVAASGNHVVDVNNLPGGRGGAIWAQTATLEACTLAGNFAEKKAGGAIVNNGDVRNCIIWGNTVAPVPPGETPPEPVQVQLAGGANILYSDVEGLLTPLPGCPPPNPGDFPGSIEQDPMFQDATVSTVFPSGTGLANLRLSQGSPCIDAADNAGFTLAATSVDLNGKPRFHDDPATTNTGAGTGPLADMGAYEFGPWVGDLPVVSFTVSSQALSATFVDTTTSINGASRLEIWDFGDGVGSCIPTASHHYAANGTHAAQLRVFDVALASAQGTPQTVSPNDTSPPVVAVTAPVGGANVVGTVVIQATATDDDIVSDVEFFVGNTSLGVDPDGFPLYEAPMPWDTTLVVDGFYTLTARATDAAGNVGLAVVTVHVVNNSPLFDCFPSPLESKVQFGDTLETQIRAIGAPPMTYTVLSGPAGLQLSTPGANNEVLLSWTPTPSDFGAHPVLIRASNASGQADLSLTLEVIPRMYLITIVDRPGYQNTGFTGLNDQGIIAGSSSVTGPSSSGGYSAPDGFIWDGATYTSIHVPASMWNWAADVNNFGIVTGHFFSSSTFYGPGWGWFTWQNGMFTIGASMVPSAGGATPRGINDTGIVVGVSAGGTTYVSPPVDPTSLPGFGLSSVYDPRGINDVDQVIGRYVSSPGTQAQMFLYDRPTDSFQLFTLAGESLRPQGINDAGLFCGDFEVCAVGSFDFPGSPNLSPGRRAFVATSPQPTVNDYVPLRIPGAIASVAYDINDSGEVVGTWIDAARHEHGFIATPAASLQHTDLGFGGPGLSHLSVTGYLGSGNTGQIDFFNAPPNTAAWLVVSTQMNPTPFVGGTIVTVPVLTYFPLFTDPQGEIHLNGIPGGGGPVTVYMQMIHVLPGAPLGYGLSNAVEVLFSP